ncbi:hypothetical protein NQ176_g11088 [Zarea fungicola]|uniref:Uncharacterized protein n=1 Tax=Zarea fungicola TaxID=93591 RepID=A0ACC1MDH9_9HYPO|nr:hypothetical protein NQ176_g11088 [Lecanicillium fungicola]
MKPVISAGHAWSCTVVSAFAIIILTVLAFVYRSGHEEFVGGENDPTPEHGVVMSGTIFTAVFVYIGFLVFCGCQGMLHVRENRRGAIAL